MTKNRPSKPHINFPKIPFPYKMTQPYTLQNRNLCTKMTPVKLLVKKSFSTQKSTPIPINPKNVRQKYPKTHQTTFWPKNNQRDPASVPMKRFYSEAFKALRIRQTPPRERSLINPAKKNSKVKFQTNTHQI